MSNATSSTRSVIITKSLCPRMSFACCASCTRMEPSSPTLELRGKEHSNCPPEAQRTVAPKLGPSRNSVFGLFVRRMGRRCSQPVQWDRCMLPQSPAPAFSVVYSYRPLLRFQLHIFARTREEEQRDQTHP